MTGVNAMEPAVADAAGERLARIGRTLALTALPVAAALAVSAMVLLAFGVDPLEYYAYVLRRSLLSGLGLQSTLTRMAPMLLVAASLILAFRAGLWNLGGDGQFMLGAVAAAAVGPALAGALPVWLVWLACMVAAMAAAAIWGLLPAVLKVRSGINEIVTTMMTSFLGISLANALIKLTFKDPAASEPQTRTLSAAERLPFLGDSTITSGLLIGVVAVLAAHFVLARTSYGFRLRVLGENVPAAIHSGYRTGWLTCSIFAISAGLCGLAGAIEVIGVQGNVRADWNPAYGMMVIPLIYLARFNGLATILFVFLYAMLSIGTESAARRMGVPHYFTYVVISVLLMAIAAVSHLAEHRARTGKARP